jgi:hypothetical protein
LQTGLEGYDRIARHTLSADAVVAITALPDADDDDGDAGEGNDEPAAES